MLEVKNTHMQTHHVIQTCSSRHLGMYLFVYTHIQTYVYMHTFNKYIHAYMFGPLHMRVGNTYQTILIKPLNGYQDVIAKYYLANK